MNSKEVYLNIYQVLSNGPVGQPDDFDREMIVHVGRASAGNVSHITTEFAGIRSKFFCCIVFDGSGDMGCSLNSFAMPKMKLLREQRAFIFLTLLEYMITNGILKADLAYFKECASLEFNGGVGKFFEQYDRICKNSRAYIAA